MSDISATHPPRPATFAPFRLPGRSSLRFFAQDPVEEETQQSDSSVAERTELLLAFDECERTLKRLGEDDGTAASRYRCFVQRRAKAQISIPGMYQLLVDCGDGETAKKIYKTYHNREPLPFEQTKKAPRPELTLSDLETFLAVQGITVRRNVLNHTVEVLGLDPDNLNSPELRAEQAGILVHDRVKAEFRCTRSLVEDLLGVIAGRHEYNPVLDLLQNIEWDGMDRLDQIYAMLHLDPADQLSRTLIRKWFCQCLALQQNSVDSPFGSDGALVLTGPQGIGKTMFARKMAMGFFKEGALIDAKDKDTIIQATSTWITEIGELDGTLKRSDAADLKRFITQEVDEYRLPYARSAVKVLRRTAFIGTVNDNRYLVDPTGNRRWWSVPVSEIDLDTLETFDTRQLWAQVKLILQMNGLQSFRLTPEERSALEYRNGEHEKEIPADDELKTILAEADGTIETFRKYESKHMTPTMIRNEYTNELGKYSAIQIGVALNKLGIKREKRRIAGGESGVNCYLFPSRVFTKTSSVVGPNE
jgi:hypothetical protein